MKSDNLLEPILTDMEPAPQELLKIVHCNCKITLVENYPTVLVEKMEYPVQQLVEIAVVYSAVIQQ